jgi:trk system potassium uptake protein TrkA
MKVIIVGCGRVGSYLARRFQEEGHGVTVVDKDNAAFARLGPGFGGNLIVGTGIDEDVLRRAGIEQADAFIAVTNWDNTNVMAGQVAREVFGVRRVICRIYDHLREEIYRELGLETICPTLLSANQILKNLALEE